MTAPPVDPADAEQLTYEQARAELARIVERLESGAETLAESLALWERGEQLADTCQRWLDGARARLDAAQAARAARAGGASSAGETGGSSGEPATR